MAARKQGQHKTEADKAQEAFDKQAEKVTRMVAKRDSLEHQLSEIEHQLAEERDMLAYYEKHPLLEIERINKQLPLDLDEDYDPAEAPKAEVREFKGLKGRAVFTQ